MKAVSSYLVIITAAVLSTASVGRSQVIITYRKYNANWTLTFSDNLFKEFEECMCHGFHNCNANFSIQSNPNPNATSITKISPASGLNSSISNVYKCEDNEQSSSRTCSLTNTDVTLCASKDVQLFRLNQNSSCTGTCVGLQRNSSDFGITSFSSVASECECPSSTQNISPMESTTQRKSSIEPTTTLSSTKTLAPSAQVTTSTTETISQFPRNVTNDMKSSEDNTGLIIGVVVAILLVAIIIVIVIIILRRRQVKKPPREDHHLSNTSVNSRVQISETAGPSSKTPHSDKRDIFVNGNNHNPGQNKLKYANTLFSVHKTESTEMFNPVQDAVYSKAQSVPYENEISRSEEVGNYSEIKTNAMDNYAVVNKNSGNHGSSSNKSSVVASPGMATKFYENEDYMQSVTHCTVDTAELSAGPLDNNSSQTYARLREPIRTLVNPYN